ncbi:MAG: hypothetical protein LBE36_03565 [Flavobacteriaceae bacterium]|jgi:hypothetical protein|nr:hypothetical protein [Flavobacteriaceae bacterium]
MNTKALGVPKIKGLGISPIYEMKRQQLQNYDERRNVSRILQIEILKKPKNFSEKLEFKIKTDLPDSERVSFFIMDSDSIFSNNPNDKNDTELTSNNSLRLGSARYSTQFTEDMQKKAFKDVEFDVAECYIKILHPKVGMVYSEIFDVEEYDFEKYKRKENWKPKSVLNLIKNADEGKMDSKRNCDMCCLNAFASNLRVLYKEDAPSNIPTNDTMSAGIKALNKKFYSEKITIPPIYKSKRLTSKSFDINDSDEFLEDVKPNIEDKLLSLTSLNEISIFAVGIAAEYHSALVVVSKNKDFKIKSKESELYGTNDNPLFLFVEDIGGSRSFREKDLDRKINEFISGAYFYYRGKRKVGGIYYNHPEKDTSLDAHIYQIYRAI